MDNSYFKNYALICNDIFKQVNNVNYRKNAQNQIPMCKNNMIKHYDLSPKGVTKRKMIKIIDELIPSINKMMNDPWGSWSKECVHINTKQNPTPSIIPYDKIDKELIDAITLLNKKGFKTRFCCWGHKPYASAFIMFDKNTSEINIAKLLFYLKDFNYKGYKWMRYCEPIDDVWSNWVLEYPAHNTPRDEQAYAELKIQLNKKLIDVLREI